MTFWCVLSFWTSRNSLLFADTLETLQGRPVWTEAISWFHGRPTACLLTPAILTWWKETPQVWFLLRSLNTCRKTWFFLLLSLFWFQIWLCQMWHAVQCFVWSHTWLISQSMFSPGPAVPGGQPRKTGTPRSLDLLNTTVWHYMAVFTHELIITPTDPICESQSVFAAKQLTQL